jgi:methylglyoxal reductase
MTVATLPRRVLGSSRIEVAGIGIGCWAIGGEDFNLGLPMGWSGTDEARSLRGLEEAYQLGANLFDTADVYGHGRSERLIGRLVSQVPRDTVVLTSKVGYFVGTARHGYEPAHMRRQLEQTLDNLSTDHLDIYFFHHANFGEADEFLPGAVEAMHQFQQQGLIRAIGMRGPHRFALDRLAQQPAHRGDKVERFYTLFAKIRPSVLAVRDNLLTPLDRSAGLFAFVDSQNCGVLINKPLGQGLLTGKHSWQAPPKYGPGDHRVRKRWFRAESLRIIEEGLRRVRKIAGPSRQDLVCMCLWACLARSERAAVLVGFTCPEQVRENLACLSVRPSDSELYQVRNIMAEVQHRLDEQGEVFADECV